MDIKIIVDKQCKLRMLDAAENLKTYFKQHNIKSYCKDVIVIFSNNHNFVKEETQEIKKGSTIINITENLSEQHIINVLKYVSDVCYLKTDVNVIASRIIAAHNRVRR